MENFPGKVEATLPLAFSSATDGSDPASNDRSAPDSDPPADPEATRLAALRSYDLLDTPPEEAFDRLTRLAADAFDVPIALITLVDGDRQWAKSCYGMDRREFALSLSFCYHAIQSEGPTAVEDMTADTRFSKNPLVTGDAHIRFYAGVPLVTPGGHALGTFCLLGHEPRAFDAEEEARLSDFAAMAMTEIERRKADAERERAQEALRTSERRHRHLIERASDIISILDPDGTIRYESPAVESILGHPPGTGGYSLGAVHPDDRPRVRQVLTALREHPDRVQSVVYRVQHADGSWVHLESVARHLPDDPAVQGIIVNTRDVSAREDARQALRASERRFRSAVENAHDVIFQTDAEARWTLLSPSWESITGYPVDESLGHRVIEYVHPDEDCDDTADCHAPVVNDDGEDGGGAEDWCVRFQTRDGQTRWLRIRSQLLRDEQGRVTGSTGTLADVTDSVQVENERQAREHAEELLEAKTNFLNNMSHELRTPLASIIGFADVLAEEGEGEQQEFADRIATSGERLQKTLDSILNLARLDGRNADMDLAPVDVSTHVSTAAAAHRPAAEAKGLTLEANVPSDGADMRASLNEGALQRILDNLLSNAIKFTDEGGVAIHVEAGARQVRLRVEDTGIGIGEDFRGQLFDDFAQESTGLARTHEGSGLGLSITRRLVERMDGTIEVESARGSGTAFIVCFPRLVAVTDEEECEAPPTAAEEPTDADTSSPRLLVVEDNANTRALARHVLAGSYDVTCAADTEEALAQLEQAGSAGATGGGFDLFLIDINLRESDDGVGLLHHLRTQLGIKAPAVAFTAHAMPGDEKRYREAGFDGYLAKPFSRKDLLGVLESALSPAATAA